MKFVAYASTQNDFEAWVQYLKQTPNALGSDEYEKLAQPSSDNPKTYYSFVDPDLYDNIIMQYMMPGMSLSGMEARP